MFFVVADPQLASQINSASEKLAKVEAVLDEEQ